MNLNKENWETVRFGDVVKNIKTNCEPLADGIERFVAGEHLITDDLKIRSWGNVWEDSFGPAFHRKFVKGQILYGSRRTYLRKAAIADFDGVCANTTFVFESKPEKLDNYLLPFIIQTPTFTIHSINNSKGSTNPFVNYKDLANYTFLLPPKDEQEKILAIFQTLENSIEHAEAQEKNLLKLKNQLLRELFGGKRQFGTYLKDADFETIKFEQIAFNISERVEPQKTDYTIYVGLEHLEPDNLKIERKGKPEDVIGVKLKIYEGDIIFGKRRAYQRKVAVADFEGICSAHSMVLRANETAIEKDLLPFFMQSDVFMNRAVQISEGSLSPTIKWKVLANQEFVIPKRAKQKQIAETFIHFDKVIEEIRQQKQTLKNLKFKLLNEILG